MISSIRYFVLVLVILTVPTGMAAQLPPLQHQQILSGIPNPTSMAFLPDGRMLVTSLNGVVWITSDVDQPPVTYSVYFSLLGLANTDAEHGLIEVILDPDFVNNNYLYLYWSTANDKNRLSRFVHLGNSTDLSTETVIYETPDPFNGCCHIGGAITFLNDGTIVLAVGDDFEPLLAQNMSSPYGKVHRFNPDGTVPIDNPYYDTTPGIYNADGVLKTIYASGLRNPWRGAYDPVADRFFISEVGGNDHTTAWEDTHVLSSGANFGWPFCGATGRDAQGMCLDPQYDDPVSTYPHAGTGACVTGGTFYRNGNWPSVWEGRYIYADFVRGWIRYMELDAAGNVIDDQPVVDTAFYPGLTADFVAKFLQGPDGNIYYIEFYDSFVSGSGAVHRLEYNANQLPVCDSIWAQPTVGPGPDLTVQFGATGTDPDNDPLVYSWSFGDASANADSANPVHTYVGYGSYTAEMVISDGTNSISCGTIDIEVGAAPEVEIVTPQDSSFFQAGQTISFQCVYSDDGPISDADIEWVVVFNHDDHIHPVAGSTGSDDYDLIIPTTGHDYSGSTWYTVTVFATDADGLQSSHSVRIYPEKELVTLNTVPSGLEVIVDGLPYITPYAIDHAIGTELMLTVPNSQQCLNGDGYLFDQWDGGFPMNYIYQVPTGSSTVTAEFVLDGPCNHCGSALDFDGVDDVVSMDTLVVSGDMSIEFWLNLDPAISASDVVIGNGTSVSVDMAGGRVSIYDGGSVASSSIIAAPNQWKHYALVRQSGLWSIYVNGVQDIGALSVAHTNDMQFSTVGQSFRPDGLNGSLDELRIWSVARTGAEIESQMDRLLDPGTAGLELYWSLDLAQGAQNIPDISGNGNSGLLGVDNMLGSDEPTLFIPNGPMKTSCVRAVPLDITMILEGAYDPITQLMTDYLRVQGLLPLTEPYTALGFDMPDSGGESTSQAVLNVTGSDAIVDWVLVELRDSDDPSQIISTRVGLLQRSGKVVGMDGISDIEFIVNRPDYKIAVRHRNHLGVMLANEVQFGTAFNPVIVDLTDQTTTTYGFNALKMKGNKYCLWAGNAKVDDVLKYAGVGNDRDAILSGIGGIIPTAVVLAYSVLDVNLDGAIKYAGTNNDRDVVLVNIGGNMPTATKVEQLP